MEQKYKYQQQVHPLSDGRSINLLICLAPDNKIKIKDKFTQQIYEITIKELYDKLNIPSKII